MSQNIQQIIDPEFEPAYRLFKRIIAKTPGGGSLCVYHHGQIVLDVWDGVRNSGGDRLQADTLVMTFSAAKGIVATLIHILADRGLLDLHQPVAEIWPEFAQQGKQNILISDILTHRAGLWDMRSLVPSAASMCDWQEVTAALAKARPHQGPLGKPAYHAITYGFLAGEIVQRATGMTFSQALRHYLAAAGGLDDLFIGLPTEQLHRRAEVMAAGAIKGQRLRPKIKRLLKIGNRMLQVIPAYDRFFHALCPKGIREFDFNLAETAQAAIPAANAFVTARSLAKMYAYLSQGGALAGTQLISPAGIAEMAKIQTRAWDWVLIGPLHWRLGYHRVVCASLHQTQTGFGHYGLGGSGGWCDPERGLAMALLVNGGIGTPLGDSRIFRLSAAVLKCADQSEGVTKEAK